MKVNNVLVTLMASVLFSCAATQKITVRTDNKPQISAREFIETCPAPDEKHFLRQFNAKVFRHSNCMNVDDLLTVIWTGELTDAAKDGVALLAIGYVAGLVKVHPDMKHTVRPLGVDTFRYQNNNYHISFFELRHRDKDNNDEKL